MITGVIKNQARGGTLVVTLPCSLYDLRDHLAKHRHHIGMEGIARGRARKQSRYSLRRRNR